MAVGMVVAAMKTRQKKNQKGALRIIEEAVHLLRTAPLFLLSVYYLGSVPFILGLLYFWADMSRSAHAHEYSAAAALGLAMLFVWMKVWQRMFVLRIHALISGHLPHRQTWRHIVSATASQTLIHATRFIVIPVAALLAVPFGYCYAFYQNVALYTDEDGQDVRPTCQWAWKLAQLWPRQNHLLIAILWLFGLVIFLNVSLTTFLIPQLIKSLLGIESIFTLSGIRMIFNSTFLIAMLGVTYLCLDPIIKAVYVLRCFYGSALTSGEDLKGELNRIQHPGAKIIAGLLMVILSMTPVLTRAETPASVSQGELEQSIEEIMERPEFSWRMPRETAKLKKPKAVSPLQAAIKWMLDTIKGALKSIGSWIKSILDWLEGLLPKSKGQSATEDRNWHTSVRMVLLLVLFIFLAIMTVIFIRIWQRRRISPVETVSRSVKPAPDLTDEKVLADELSSNRWLAIAGELAEKGELRLAMRALYLATLAHLADNEMITIESYKSNRDYERELKRRAHEHMELITIFSTNLNVFERAWYGMERIARSEFDRYSRNQQRIFTFA